jgi:hypothetical protein
VTEGIPENNAATTTTDGTTPPAVPAVAPAVTEVDFPDWAKNPATAAQMVKDLRAENASARTSAKEAAAAEARTELLKQLGLIKENEPVDPAQVARDIAAKDQQIRELTLRGALSDALHTAGAKPLARAAILGDGVLADLDPSSATFNADVAARVSEYIGKNPELKTTQAAAASGVDTTGGAQQGRIYTRAQLRDNAFYQANKADIDLAASQGRIH